MLERTKYSDGLGAIYPPMMYIIMALDLLGYAPDHPDRVEAQKQFDTPAGRRRRALLLPALLLAGLGHRDRRLRAGRSRARRRSRRSRSAADWLLSKEVRRKGDWSVKRPNTEPSGWYFEFANEFYPDIDDTAMVLLALRARARRPDPAAQQACEKRAVNWLLGMQSNDGGWAAFDVDNNWDVLSDVPFADHNAMLDPTCPDITGPRARGAVRLRRGPPDIRPCGAASSTCRGRRSRTEAGTAAGASTTSTAPSWPCAGLRGRRRETTARPTSCAPASGCAPSRTPTAAGARAAPATTTTPSSPRRSTPSQTAWAVLGLLAGGDTTSQSVHKGIEYLIETQRADGSWDEDLATGTGFPESLLPELSPVPALLPAAGAG